MYILRWKLWFWFSFGWVFVQWIFIINTFFSVIGSVDIWFEFFIHLGFWSAFESYICATNGQNIFIVEQAWSASVCVCVCVWVCARVFLFFVSSYQVSLLCIWCLVVTFLYSFLFWPCRILFRSQDNFVCVAEIRRASARARTHTSDENGQAHNKVFELLLRFL